jgi:hypothetical protein
MTCIPGNIRVAHSEEAYHTQQYRPVDPTAKRHRVECDICGVSLAVESLRSHLETKHDTYWSFVLNQELTIEREPIVYQATTDATDLLLSGTGMCGRCRLRKCFKITLSLTPSPGSGRLPSGRVPFPAAMQQMWPPDLIYGH